MELQIKPGYVFGQLIDGAVNLDASNSSGLLWAGSMEGIGPDAGSNVHKLTLNHINQPYHEVAQQV